MEEEEEEEEEWDTITEVVLDRMLNRMCIKILRIKGTNQINFEIDKK